MFVHVLPLLLDFLLWAMEEGAWETQYEGDLDIRWVLPPYTCRGGEVLVSCKREREKANVTEAAAVSGLDTRHHAYPTYVRSHNVPPFTNRQEDGRRYVDFEFSHRVAKQGEC